MKKYFKIKFNTIKHNTLGALLLICLSAISVSAQESTDAPAPAKVKPVKNTFGSAWLLDNQSVMVPIKGTLEFDIQHRFGAVNKEGIKDLYGFFAPSNIRLGLSYAPLKHLSLGAGITKERMQVDMSAKYGLLQQTKGSSPVSVTYFVNWVIDARDKSNFRASVHRFSYFHQLIIARKLSDKISIQLAPSYSWFNNIEGYVDSKGEIQNKMNNGHFAVSMGGRYKMTDKFGIIAGFDQPITQHPTNNPHPNISFGFEVTTSSHAFQVFATNYYGIVPQSNNFFNQVDYTKGQFLIGFNITRLWNY